MQVMWGLLAMNNAAMIQKSLRTQERIRRVNKTRVLYLGRLVVDLGWGRRGGGLRQRT